MMYGMDYLGGAMFGKVLTEAHPKGWAAGFFAETFGNVFPVIDRLAATGKCPLIRVQGPWTNHAYNPRIHDKDIFRAFDSTVRLQLKYKHIDFQFSPVCESDAKGEPWQKLFKVLAERHHALELVCSVGTRGEFVKGILSEVHGNTPRPRGNYNYSYDGTNAVDSDVTADKKTHSMAQVFFLWHPSFNLRYKTKLGLQSKELPSVWENDKSTPRKRKARPTVELIESLVALGSDKGVTKLKPGNLWKSHADRHETPPKGRSYKPVLITPENVENISLYTPSGTKVAISYAKENFVDGRFRYYFHEYGYQISKEVLMIRAENIVLGTINPAFREGDFR